MRLGHWPLRSLTWDSLREFVERLWKWSQNLGGKFQDIRSILSSRILFQYAHPCFLKISGGAIGGRLRHSSIAFGELSFRTLLWGRPNESLDSRSRWTSTSPKTPIFGTRLTEYDWGNLMSICLWWYPSLFIFILLGTFSIVYPFIWYICFACVDQFRMPFSGRHPESCGLSPQALNRVCWVKLWVSLKIKDFRLLDSGDGMVQSSTTSRDSQILNFERHPISVPPHRIISIQSIVSKMMDGKETLGISYFHLCWRKEPLRNFVWLQGSAFPN